MSQIIEENIQKLTKKEEIENSIRTAYRKKSEKFIKAINDFNEEYGDKIVGVSRKDS